MTNAYDLIGRTRGDVAQVGQTRGAVAQIGRARGDLAFVGVSDVLDLGGGGPAPFDPTTYGTVISWASAKQGTYTDGAAVSTLADESGNGNGLTAPAGSNESTYAAGPPAEWAFDGDDYYRGASKTPYNRLHLTTGQGGGGGTVAVLYRWDDADGSAFAALWATRGTNSGNNGVVITVDNRFTESVRTAVGTGAVQTDAVSLDTGWHTAVLVSDPDSSEWHVYSDGVLLNTRAFTPSAGVSQTLPTLGAEAQFPSLFELRGAVASVVVWEDILTGVNVAALHGELIAEVTP